MARKSNTKYTEDCPVERTLEIIGGKWKSVILYQLLGGAQRFNGLRRLLPQVTPRMLTKQLRELEESGLLERNVHPQTPPRVEYRLTEVGKTLKPLLMSLKKWGETYLQ